jgi:hypothetical protein
MRRSLLFLAAIALPFTAAADIGPGETVVDGIMADITNEGFDFIEEQAATFVPSEIPLDDMSLYEEPIWECEMQIDVSNLQVEVQLDDLQITPAPDVLQVQATALIWVNSQWDPLNLEVDAGGVLCWAFDASCAAWTDVMTAEVTIQMNLEIIDPGNGDPPYLDATVPTIVHNLDSAIDSQAIHLDCWIGSLIDFIEFFGVDVLGMIIDTALADVYTLIDELPATIEEAVEDGFAQAQYVDTVDIAGVPLDIELVPHDIIIDHYGLRLAMNSTFDAPQAECISAYDPGVSPFTDNPPPDLDPNATYHLRALLGDDAVASALYAVWHGGVLCYELDPAELGFPLDTSFVALMADEDDRPLIERIWLDESQPIMLRTTPKEPPAVDFNGAHDLDATVDNLGLDFFALTQDRMARVLTVDVDVDAGVNVITPGDGSIEIELDIDSENLSPEVSYDEFVGDLSSQIETNFSDIMSGLLDTVLGSFLPDLAFGVMQIAGLGIYNLDLGPDGPAGDFLAAEVTLDLVQPECEGNLAALGCAGADLGCGGGSDPLGCGGGDDDDDTVGDDDDSADPCSCQSSCEDGSCDSGCEVARSNSQRVRAIWAGNLMLLGACLLALGWWRKIAR